MREHRDEGVLGRVGRGQVDVPMRQIRLELLALRDVADVALDDGVLPLGVDVADELHVDLRAGLGLERQVFVADVALLLQLLHRGLAGLRVLEQADLPQLLAQQFGVFVAQQLVEERIGVRDAGALRILLR